MNTTDVFFATCKLDELYITPGGAYALTGAAAAPSGMNHVTHTIRVIMFELIGAITYILPIMIVVSFMKVVVKSSSPARGAVRLGHQRYKQ